MTKRVITIPLQDEAQTYTPRFALFGYEDGRAVLTPCDSEGNELEDETETEGED